MSRRERVLLAEMIDAAEQARELVKDRTVAEIEADQASVED